MRVSSAPRGFDRLSIKGPSALQFVEARVGGNRVEVEVQNSENQFEVRFDRCATVSWSNYALKRPCFFNQRVLKDF